MRDVAEDKAPAWAIEEDIEVGGPPARTSEAPSVTFSSNKPSYSSPSADEAEGDDFDFSKPSSGSNKNNSAEEEGEEEDAWGNVAKAEPKNDPQQLLMDQFYKDVENIKTDIDKLKNATKRILDLMEKILASTSEVTDRTLNNEMRQTVDDTNKVAKNTKNLLALLKEENTKYKKDKKIEASNMRFVYEYFSMGITGLLEILFIHWVGSFPFAEYEKTCVRHSHGNLLMR
jgi:hypothetical protein